MTCSTDDSRVASSGPAGTSNGTRASVRVRFARTMRCAMVDTGTRKARAISSVVRLPRELLLFALEPLVAAEPIDRAMLRSGHEPGARFIRDTRLGPLLESRDEGVLREVFRGTHVAHDPRESRDESWRLDPPYRIDRAMGVSRRHQCGPLLLEDLLDDRVAIPDDLPEALRPFDRLVARLHIYQSEAAGQLLRLGERSVGHGELAARAADARGLCIETAGREQDARSRRVLDELRHLGHDLGARRLRRLGVVARRVEQESHLRISSWSFLPRLAGPRTAAPRLYLHVEQRTGEIDTGRRHRCFRASGPLSACPRPWR